LAGFSETETHAEDEQITRQGIAAELRGDHRSQPIKALATVHRFDAHPNAAAQSQGQHAAALKAAISLATAAASAQTGTRTTFLPMGMAI
jgi:hypothetical protein